LWLLLLLTFINSVSEIINPAYMKKALAKSLAIYKPRRSRLSSQNLFFLLGQSPAHAAASVKEFKWRGGIKIVRHPLPLFTGYCNSGLFSLPENKI
jgi:hypothetical protein